MLRSYHSSRQGTKAHGLWGHLWSVAVPLTKAGLPSSAGCSPVPDIHIPGYRKFQYVKKTTHKSYASMSIFLCISQCLPTTTIICLHGANNYSTSKYWKVQMLKSTSCIFYIMCSLQTSCNSSALWVCLLRLLCAATRFFSLLLNLFPSSSELWDHNHMVCLLWYVVSWSLMHRIISLHQNKPQTVNHKIILVGTDQKDKNAHVIKFISN